MRLEGRHALVVGGGRGVGRGVALALAREGADVGILYRRDSASAAATIQQIRDLDRRGVSAQADVIDQGQVQSAIQSIVETLGPVDALVFCAGNVSRGRYVADTEVAEFRKLLEVHLFGAIHCVQAVLPGMRQAPRGDIVVISSVITRQWRPGTGPYAIAKGSLEGLMRVLAHEEQPHGIRVNAIAPSIVNSDMGRRLLKARGFEDTAKYVAEAPFGRIVEPEDVGDLCAYLLSERGGYVSGQVIYMDGAV